MAEESRNNIGAREYKINRLNVYPTRYPAISLLQFVSWMDSRSKIAHWMPMMNMPQKPS